MFNKKNFTFFKICNTFSEVCCFNDMIYFLNYSQGAQIWKIQLNLPFIT
jgi:hypothetical protein